MYNRKFTLIANIILIYIILLTKNGDNNLFISLIGTSVPATPNKLATFVYLEITITFNLEMVNSNKMHTKSFMFRFKRKKLITIF